MPTTLKIMTNGGLLTATQQVHLKNYGNVWYQPKYISNILSLSNINKKNRIIYDSENGDRFIVINKIPGGHNMIFTANNDGLYYNDMSSTKGVSMLSIMEENQRHYNQQQYEREKTARKIYQTVGHPSIKDYKNIIKMNEIKNVQLW